MSGHSCRIGAMKDRNIGIAVVCMSKDYVVFDNGLKLPINYYLDVNRNPITSPGVEPQYYEFGDDENGYGVGNLDAYQMPSYKDH